MSRLLALIPIVLATACATSADGPGAATPSESPVDTDQGAGSGTGAGAESDAGQGAGEGTAGVVDGSAEGTGADEGSLPVPTHVPGVVDHQVEAIDGRMVNLTDFRGNVMLVVNTASRCGFTPQYEGLQELYDTYRDRGLVVLGFPANNFAGQEPGSNEEIAEFCEGTYAVRFPMFGKVEVLGNKIAPLYVTLTTEGPDETRGDISWNFTKFLIDREGRIIARFAPAVEPTSAEVIAALEAALGTP